MKRIKMGLSCVSLCMAVTLAACVEPGQEDRAADPGLTRDQAAALQQRVDEVLADIPGGHQVSATELRYDGLTVTFDPRYPADKTADAAFAPSDIICSDGWFCIVVRGTTFSFFKCQTWDLSNWLGTSPFNNNQTPGTVARFYDINGVERWRNTAKDSGYVDVTPFWKFRPC